MIGFLDYFEKEKKKKKKKIMSILNKSVGFVDLNIVFVKFKLFGSS